MNKKTSIVVGHRSKRCHDPQGRNQKKQQTQQQQTGSGKTQKVGHNMKHQTKRNKAAAARKH
jgi:hypothetical protein